MWNFLKSRRDRAKPDLTASEQRQGFVREFVDGEFVVQLDETNQMLKLHAEDAPTRKRTALFPTIPRLPKDDLSEGLVSASILAFKAKQFDDGLYAAVDLAAQHGSGKFPGKMSLLTELTANLARGALQGEMSEVVFAAARLGGIPVERPAAMELDVALLIEDFLANEKRSKTLGFYTWTEELKRIFRQDRMLQSEVGDPRAVDEVARTLRDHRSAYAAYAGYLTLISKLTNPLVAPDLRDAVDNSLSECAFFPPSRAYETDLMAQLYGDSPIPEGFSLVQEMIQRIRDGRLRLKPTEKSGWYDYQTWALEPLVLPEGTPEAAKLKFSDKYKEHLLDLFRGTMALTRETHVKQLETVMCGSALFAKPPRKQIYVSPQLSVEPLAEFYGRRAIAYSFVRDVLVETFGQEGLKEMRRMTPNGPVELPLKDELEQMIALFRGARGCVSRQLALPQSDPLPQLSDLDSAISAFQDWASGVDKDPDLSRDARMMVPIFYDVGRQKTKVWVVLGWARRMLSISYATPPIVRVKDKRGRAVGEKVDVNFSGQYEAAFYPVSAELYVSRLLNREEFQKHCDQYESREEILARLA